ncbi:MAG: hypothetical protein HP495_03215 [Nitrospira sp.]|nr:hypothetical protein [Nitrospira sp.]
MNIADYLERKRIDVDRFLDLLAPPSVTPPTTLHESLRYSLMAGGKRVRPILAIGSGNMGMVGGQVLDIQAENKDIDLPTLQNIHKHKTGMLMRAAVRMGAIAAGASDRQLDDMTGYAEDIGLAFQIADDVLNVTGTREELGKNPNTDAERGKKTYPTFYGVDGAKKLADDCVTRAIHRLSSFGPSADPLREIARYITNRKN